LNPAYSVILFTTASGAGYGLLFLLGLVGISHGKASSPAFAATTMVVALGLITIGLLSSTFHLGHPERAWRAFSQWRSSWLSREGILAVATYPIALLFALYWSGIVDCPRAVAPLGVATAIMCIATVYCTAMIYASLKTIRQWKHALTVPVYLAFALATGACLLAAIASPFGRLQPVQLAIAAVAILAVIILKFFYWRGIDAEPRTRTTGSATGLGENVRQWEVPHTATNFVQKEMGFVVARKHARRLRNLALLLLALAFVSVLSALVISPFAILAALLSLAAAVVERWLFFAEAEHISMLYYGIPKA
jgi:sulfite dehydrogenase (quinone) subunit SoeC